MHNHEKLTKREKIAIGTTVVTTCIAGYFGYKYFSEIKLAKPLYKSIGQLDEQLMSLEDSIDTLKAAMEETGRM